MLLCLWRLIYALTTICHCVDSTFDIWHEKCSADMCKDEMLAGGAALQMPLFRELLMVPSTLIIIMTLYVIRPD